LDTSWLTYAVPVALVGAFLLFKRLGQLNPAEARKLVQEGAKLIDVRSPAEFGGGHLPGALNIPLPELGARANKLGPKDKPLVLYCASGTRSSMARSVLKGLGFTQVFNLGSMSRW
jgi:phage shock protein E